LFEAEEVAAGGRLVASVVSLSCLTGLQPKAISQKDATDGSGRRKKKKKNPHESINVSFNFYWDIQTEM